MTAAKSYTVACRYPPRRADLVVGRIRDRPVDLTWRYESTSADVSAQFLAR